MHRFTQSSFGSALRMQQFNISTVHWIVTEVFHGVRFKLFDEEVIMVVIQTLTMMIVTLTRPGLGGCSLNGAIMGRRNLSRDSDTWRGKRYHNYVSQKHLQTKVYFNIWASDLLVIPWPKHKTLGGQNWSCQYVHYGPRRDFMIWEEES